MSSKQSVIEEETDIFKLKENRSEKYLVKAREDINKLRKNFLHKSEFENSQLRLD